MPGHLPHLADAKQGRLEFFDRLRQGRKPLSFIGSGVQFVEGDGGPSGADCEGGAADAEIVGGGPAVPAGGPDRCAQLTAGGGPGGGGAALGGHGQPLAAVDIQIVPHAAHLAPELSGFIGPVGQLVAGFQGIGALAGHGDGIGGQTGCQGLAADGDDVGLAGGHGVLLRIGGLGRREQIPADVADGVAVSVGAGFRQQMVIAAGAALQMGAVLAAEPVGAVAQGRDGLAQGDESAAGVAVAVAGVAGGGAGGGLFVPELGPVAQSRDGLALDEDLAAAGAAGVAGVACAHAGGAALVSELPGVAKRRDDLALGQDLAADGADLVAGEALGGAGGGTGVGDLGDMVADPFRGRDGHAVGAAAEGGHVHGIAVGGEADVLQLGEQTLGEEGELALPACVDLAVWLGGVEGAVRCEGAVENAVVVGEDAGDILSVIAVDAAVVIDPGAAVPLGKPGVMVGGDHVQVQALLRMVGQAPDDHQVPQVDPLSLGGLQVIGIEDRRLPGTGHAVIGGGQAVDGVLRHDDVLAPDQTVHGLHAAADGGEGPAAVMADEEAPVAGGHGDGQGLAVVPDVHLDGDGVGRDAGAVGEVPVQTAVMGNGEGALGPVSVRELGIVGHVMAVAPQAVDQALGVGVEVKIVAGVVDVLIVLRQDHPTEALAVVPAVLQTQIRGADDDVVGIEGVLPDGVGGLDVQATGAVGAVGVGDAVGGLHAPVILAAVADHIDRLGVGEQEEVIVLRVHGHAVEGTVAAVAPAVIDDGAAGLVHGVEDPLEGVAVELHDTGLGAVLEGQVDVFEVVAADLLEMPAEGPLDAPFHVDIGEGVQIHQVAPVHEVLGAEDPGGLGGVIQQEQPVADPLDVLQTALGGVEPGEGIGGAVIFPQAAVEGVVQHIVPDGHIDLGGGGCALLDLLGVEDQQIVAVVVGLHQHEVALPVRGGEPDLVGGGGHGVQVAVVVILRQHQVLVPAAAADPVFDVFGVDQLQALALILADIQTVAACEDIAVFRNAGTGQPAVGLRPLPGIAPVIGIIKTAHVTGGIEAVGVGGIDQRSDHSTTAADA